LSAENNGVEHDATKPVVSAQTTIGPNLATKIARVMADIERVPKSGFNSHHNYAYSTEGDVSDVARKAMSVHNLALVSSIASYETVKGKTKSGSDSYLTNVRVDFKLIDGDSGESHEFSYVGAGQDTGEKGIFKAYTSAKKYALLMTFLIPTGDDPEANTADQDSAQYDRQPQQRESGQRSQNRQQRSSQRPKSSGATSGQIDAIRKLNANIGLTDQDLRRLYVQHIYKVNDVSDLTKDQASELIQLLSLKPHIRKLADARSNADVDEVKATIGRLNLQGRVAQKAARELSSAFERVAANGHDQADDTDDVPDELPDDLPDESPFSEDEERELDKVFGEEL
jgi:hypothetical protein